MSRKDKRKAKATGRATCPDLDLRQGRIVSPIFGTTFYGPEGTPQGIWGLSLPIAYMQALEDGTLRPLTRAEDRLARRVYGPP